MVEAWIQCGVVSCKHNDGKRDCMLAEIIIDAEGKCITRVDKEPPLLTSTRETG